MKIIHQVVRFSSGTRCWYEIWDDVNKQSVTSFPTKQLAERYLSRSEKKP